MHTDSTFCVSSKCPKADTCDRWWMNHFVETNDMVSMFDPYKKGDICVYYQKAVCSKADRKVAKRRGGKICVHGKGKKNTK
jgi:hypothetical protein